MIESINQCVDILIKTLETEGSLTITIILFFQTTITYYVQQATNLLLEGKNILIKAEFAKPCLFIWNGKIKRGTSFLFNIENINFKIIKSE